MIRPHRLLGVVSPHVLIGSAGLGVCQRHQRGSGVAASSQGFSCLCFHVVLLSLQGEQSVAELRGAQNKPSAEGADLHVAAAQMSSVSEALALDKVRLNKLVSQVSGCQRSWQVFVCSCCCFSDFLPSDCLNMEMFLLLSKPNLLHGKSYCISFPLCFCDCSWSKRMKFCRVKWLRWRE